MNNWKDIIKKVKPTIVNVKVVVDNKEIISEGTGVVISRYGHIATAKHVVNEYICDQNRCRIYIFLNNKPPIEYKASYYVEEMDVLGVDFITNSNHLDVAILMPNVAYTTDCYMRLNNCVTIEEGEDVLMCGYSTEINNRHFFKIDNLIDSPEIKDMPTIIRPIIKQNLNFSTMFQPIFFKRGIVSTSLHVNYSKIKNGPVINACYFHIDNVCHEGMSGGPIFNIDGELIGIINLKNTVSAQVQIENDNKLANFSVHAGSSMGVSVHAVIGLSRK